MTQEIRTERLVLRPFVEGDGAQVVPLLNDYEVSKWLAKVPHPFRAQDLRLHGEGGVSRWPSLAAVCRGDTVMGGISLHVEHLGYWLGRHYWGQGYASEAVSAGVAFLMKNGAQQICSGVFEGNEASARILRKCGFQEASRDVVRSVARAEDCPNINYMLTRDNWRAAR